MMTPVSSLLGERELFRVRPQVLSVSLCLPSHSVVFAAFFAEEISRVKQGEV